MRIRERPHYSACVRRSSGLVVSFPILAAELSRGIPHSPDFGKEFARDGIVQTVWYRHPREYAIQT
jgi:hypothetical protein